MADFRSGPHPGLPADDPRCRAVILVEGESDRAALTVLAARRDRDLTAEGIAILPMGGATSIGRYLSRYGPGGTFWAG